MPSARDLILSFFSNLDHPVEFIDIKNATGIRDDTLRKYLTSIRHEGKIDKSYPHKWIKVGVWHV